MAAVAMIQDSRFLAYSVEHNEGQRKQEPYETHCYQGIAQHHGHDKPSWTAFPAPDLEPATEPPEDIH